MPKATGERVETYWQTGRYALESGLSEHSDKLDINDIASIDLYWTDGSDEPAFAWVVQKHDGDWLALVGWHDYTGWDCQSGIEVFPAEDRKGAIQLCGDDPRRAWEEAKYI